MNIEEEQNDRKLSLSEKFDMEDGDFSDSDSSILKNNPIYERVLDSRNTKYHSYSYNFGDALNNVNNLPLRQWFDFEIGTISIEQPHTTVYFSVKEATADWKYGLYIDYVLIQPV